MDDIRRATDLAYKAVSGGLPRLAFCHVALCGHAMPCCHAAPLGMPCLTWHMVQPR